MWELIYIFIFIQLSNEAVSLIYFFVCVLLLFQEHF